jgi:23S rRNA pseudouridine1911/1915/1917 synthase
MHIDVLFENELFIIINKPSGVVVHPFDKSTEKTLVDVIFERYPETKCIPATYTLQNGTVIPLGGIVHKLDRETSGIMVIAKNAETQHLLQQQFKDHLVNKTYIALVEGVVSASAFRINAPLGRNKKDYKQVAYPENPRGELREAVTDVEVLLRSKTVTLVKLSPITGRTHQLRAHMTYSGYPIVGDKAYGSSQPSSRIMLHAQKLRFILYNKEYTFEAPAPQDFIQPFE